MHIYHHRLLRVAAGFHIAICWVAVLTLIPAVSAAAMNHTVSGPQHWKGTVELPGGSGQLDFVITFTLNDTSGGWWGTIDIPVQGVRGLGLQDIEINDQTVKFTLAPPGAPEMAWAKFEITIDDTGDAGTGVLRQSGLEMPLTMARTTPEAIKADLPKRPQTPQPPFPYEARDIFFKNEAAGILISGTLTIPTGDGPHPAVILITGSGAQDRDETIFEHKPFAVIADYLTRRGIAVLRVDDRGVGGTNGSITDSTSYDFAGDVQAGLSFLNTVSEIDSTRLGLIGHSEGGIIAPIVATTDDRVAFIVLLAGTGLPGSEILTLQTELALLGSGIDPEKAATQIELQRHLLNLLMDESVSKDDLRAAVLEMIQHERVMLGLDEMLVSEEEIEAVVAMQIKQMKSKWFRAFLTLDPRVHLRKVTCPVLALNGSLDFQVPPDSNLPEIKKALAEAGNNDVTIRELPGLNHLFQHAETGMFAEYAQIEETFAPEALEIMSDWIRARTGLEAVLGKDGKVGEVEVR